MRKFIMFLAFFWLIFIFISSFLVLNGCPQSLDGLPLSVTSPEKMALWFKNEFKMHMRIPDEPQSPGETIAFKSGDCDDFACLASVILSRLGIPNSVIVIEFEGLEIAHAICVWKNHHGTYNFISNRRIYRTGDRRVIEMIRRHYSDWRRITFVDIERNTLKTVKRRKR